MRTQKQISETKTSLSRSEKARVFKVLGFKNQTEFLKTKTNKPKSEAIVDAIKTFNIEIKGENEKIIKQRRKTKTLKQYEARIKKTVNEKDVFKRIVNILFM